MKLPPFTDLPEHVAVMASLAHLRDVDWRIAATYTFDAAQSQYLLYHLAGAGLTLLVGSAELANKLLLATAGVAYPFALRSLLRALGRDTRLAIFAIPLFWNRALVVGFLPFVASIPVVLWGISLVFRELEAPSQRRRVGLALLAVVTFYLHANAYLVLVCTSLAALVVACVASVPEPASIGGRARALVALAGRALWLVPSALCAAEVWVRGKITVQAGSLAEPGEVVSIGAFRSAHAFGLWAHDIWVSHVDEICGLLFWSAYLVLLVRSVASERFSLRDRAVVPFLVVLALYFLLPFRVGAGAMLNVRLAPVLSLLAIVVLRPAPGRATRMALGAAVVASCVTFVNAAWEMRRAYDEGIGDIDPLLARVPRGARLLSLAFSSPPDRTRFPAWVHVGAYHRARDGGIAGPSFSDLHHWPLHYRPESAPPKKIPFWEFQPCVFRNATDGEFYDYVLARGLDPFRDAPPGPVYREVARHRDFVLFEKVAGASNPDWSFADLGPCVDRDKARELAEHGPRADSR